jgi:hypothetical protein
MTDKEREDFEWASSFYLYADLDKEWDNWDEEKLFEEISALAWQPFEHWEGEDIYNEINKLASSVRQKIEKETNESI